MSPSLLSHLQYITSQPPSCTLVTCDQEQVEVQSHLLSLLSPLLASLLAQVGDCPYLSIPCTASQIRKILNSIVNGENVGSEDTILANILGMSNLDVGEEDINEMSKDELNEVWETQLDEVKKVFIITDEDK